MRKQVFIKIKAMSNNKSYFVSLFSKLIFNDIMSLSIKQNYKKSFLLILLVLSMNESFGQTSCSSNAVQYTGQINIPQGQNLYIFVYGQWRIYRATVPNTGNAPLNDPNNRCEPEWWDWKGGTSAGCHNKNWKPFDYVGTCTLCSNGTAIAGSNMTVCQGATSGVLGGSIADGATGGTWTASSGTVNDPTNVAGATYTPNGATGNITLTLTTSGGCAPVTVSKIITVNAIPAQPGAISGTTTFCSPTTSGQIYSIPAVPSGATSINWGIPTGWSAQVVNPLNITVTTGTAGQNGNISATASNSCGTSAASTLAVTVANPKPAQPGVITGTATQCPSLTSQTYNIASVTNATSYTWTVPTGWTVTGGAGTASITVTTGTAAQNGNI
ncbi:MAG: hypothetical protein RL060_1817, partial [Bacteroidota bacterium]